MRLVLEAPEAMIAAGANTARRRGEDLAGGLARRRERRRYARLLVAAISLAASAARGGLLYAVTPESPEVLALVDKALAYLDSHTHDELGGKCLIALAYHKRGMSHDHPKIQEAIESCRQSVKTEPQLRSYLYGKCLAIIFLCELDAGEHRELIDAYASQVKEHQKSHGGFGYIASTTGDTSQTQYAALAFWSMHNHGISPDAESVQKCINWLMRTRDPSGMWGYQGQDPGSFELIQQQDKPGLSMTAAGMSGVMILGNMVGLLVAPQEEQAAELVGEAPAALRRVEKEKSRRAPPLPAGDVDRKRLAAAIQAGRSWFEKNFSYRVHEYQSYYFYSVERYMSFQEYLDGEAPEEPEWYNMGFELLKKSQAPDGSWNDNAGPECATAFSILFLLRSTQKSIAAALGEGTLVGGRGLPRDLSKVRIRGGKLIVEQKPTEVDQLLGMLDEDDPAAFDALLDDPAALKLDHVGPEDARRLQQLARSPSAGARLLAVRALAKLRSLDQAPTLIYALTDPDRRVVREARDGLRSISRNFEGFGPPDNYDEAQQRQAVERWKAWYRSVRPAAAPLP